MSFETNNVVNRKPRYFLDTLPCLEANTTYILFIVPYFHLLGS